MSNQHPAGLKPYFIVWGALAALTLLALAGGNLRIAEGARALFFVAITIAKVTLIAAVFMHLRFERSTLVAIALVPIVFAVALVIGISPDTHDSSTRFILSLH
jgi:caa(3)-type oxidase subunit IV